MQLKPNAFLQNGKYRIIRVLGQGGFGITYLAEHTMLDKEVAIKEFFPKEYCDRDSVTSQLTIGSKHSVEIVSILKSKFIKEARNISKLHNANIITIHDIFEENNTAYYVMDYVEGYSLSEIIKRDGSMPEAIALKYIKRIAEAIGYMHTKSMNHLDIKPANIMIRKDDDEPVLIDFGLSKQYDASGGQTSTTPVGISHGFAPAEQYRPGGVATFTPQTDIYALGATLYNLLSGVIPPHYSEILDEGLPELPTSVSKQTEKAIIHAMEVSKNRRPTSIQIFLKELARSHDDSTIESISHSSNSLDTNLKSLDFEDTHLIKSDSPQEVYEVKNNLLNRGANHIRKKQGEDVTIDNMKFIDLGLSVKWAVRNIGANSAVDPGKYFEKGPENNNFEIYEWNMKGAKVPSIQHYKELINKCNWEWIDQNGFYGYKVTGPNGNSILFQVTGEGSMNNQDLKRVNYGILWTNESINREYESQSMVFYYNPYTYQLIHYPSYNKRPIRLITE